MHRAALALFLLPLSAVAHDDCRFRASRDIDADVSGVRSVRFIANAYELDVSGKASAQRVSGKGVACASSQAALDALEVAQEKRGDTLVVELRNRNAGGASWGQDTSLKLDVTVPARLPVSVAVGSGEATVHDTAALDGNVGSGHLEARDIHGSVSGSVGSGEAKVERADAIDMRSVGSGELTVVDISGDARVGTLGSGELSLERVGADVSIGTVGSGSAQVRSVKGGLHVRTVGSGDVSYHDIGGRVDVPPER